jgi:hypothetical protein
MSGWSDEPSGPLQIRRADIRDAREPTTLKYVGPNCVVRAEKSLTFAPIR